MTKNERIKELKELRKLANDNLNQYKVLGFDKNKSWISNKTKISIQELKEIIKKINYDLHPDQVEHYCTLHSKNNSNLATADDLVELFNVVMSQARFDTMIFDIARLSPSSNILMDISWLPDGNVGDYFSIYLQKKDISILEKYLPRKIVELEDRIIPQLRLSDEFEDIVVILETAIDSSNKENFIASSLLLITASESLVRVMAQRIYKIQNPNISSQDVQHHIYSKYHSLESLIIKGNWLSDYPIKFSEALVFYKDVNADSLNLLREKYSKHIVAKNNIERKLKKLDENTTDQNILLKYLTELKTLSGNLMTENDKEIKINLAVMLDFLVRKYKDDRNQIIHGNFKNYNLKWKNYINFAAVVKIFDVFTEYNKFYKSSDLCS
ncbi:hypothetical protein J2799_001694 [Chryseobacterium vietnamense]|uniref:hypothetical protein n=1 Tax=Chryseobacterium vietnamense TaxID=866785 RepID=UPI0028678CE0|nr:hypothetical protein [Chryseobacterium vietnamense]MDR6487209.1 hypothetical protein [Chryseobacterium vietnamense]